MRGGPQDGGIGDEATDEALRALAEPRRRAILRLVAHDELAAGEIAAGFDVTRTAVSQHLTVLRHAGLLAERRDGTRRLYRARPEGLAGLQKFLDDMWGHSLDLARRLVEAERGISDGPPPTWADTGRTTMATHEQAPASTVTGLRRPVPQLHDGPQHVGHTFDRSCGPSRVSGR